MAFERASGCASKRSLPSTSPRSTRRSPFEARAPLGCVLEGGYALGALARSVAVTMGALSGASDEDDELIPLTPAAAKVRRRLESDAYAWFA